LVCALFSLLLIAHASAASPAHDRPAVVFGVPVIDSEGFTRDAWDGAQAFERLHGVSVNIVNTEGANFAPDRISALLERTAASGASPVVAVGYLFSEALTATAMKFPRTRFVLVDAEARGDNVMNLVFREEEGAFLAGALAAMKSRTKILGFVGAVDIPVIRRFGCGYVLGAKYIAPDIRILQATIGQGPEAFIDRDRAQRLSLALLDQGADVLFHAAGAAGQGVIEAAKIRGLLAIGTDTNQNATAPGTVLSSLLKRMDVAVYIALREASAVDWRSGSRTLGLRERGMGLAMDRHNAMLIDDVQYERLGELQFALIDRSLSLPAGAANTACSAMPSGQ
jgi:basic membrane protein A